jgi:hypothetical protein
MIVTALHEPVKQAESDNQRRSSFFQPGIVQAKLDVNEPGDMYEQEADAMADKVMRTKATEYQGFFKPAPALIQRKHHGAGELDDEELHRKEIPSVQRKCEHCEEEDEMLQRMESTDAKAQDTGGLNNYIGSLGASGQPLSGASRKFFEPRFGYDFSDVRVHNDPSAAQSARSIDALAYTAGNHIVFNQGQYSPDTETGQKLMAHELTHVIQQHSGAKKIQRLKVRPVGSLMKGTCGEYHRKWDFILDKAAADDGYIIQKVDYYKKIVDCPQISACPAKPDITFWEAWPVNKNDTVHIMHSKGYTDQSFHRATPNKSGSVAKIGEIRFFLKSVIGDLGTIGTANPKSSWKIGNQGGVQQSGPLPTTTTAPSWWSKSVEGPASRSASADWTCCGKGSDFFTVNVNP